MAHQLIDTFATRLRPETKAAVYDGSKKGHEKRTKLLFDNYAKPDDLRKLAGKIKQHVIENLDTYLPATEERLKENGINVHWASTAEAACNHVLEIMRARGAKRVVKAKTMVSEEIELEAFLNKHDIECLETDLGEFIVQLDHDKPSHIVKPIIHKSRREIAELFEKNGLGAYDDEPQVITRRAREFLRKKYLEGDVAITGANFVIAESGRIVLVTNEGNSRFCLAATSCHIAIVGIEKILPRDRDLALLLNLLGRSGTAQELTVYTEFISGAKASTQPDGPQAMHVIFVDNGRTDVLASDCKEILRCIRCGACLNVCPVYRQASGHAYRSVYPGPVGAVLSPLLLGKNFPQKADLPKASSLCGACNEVCPVDIPIPDLLLRLRAKAKQEGVPSPGTPPMGGWAVMASQPAAWKAALVAGKLINFMPTKLLPVPPLRAWEKTRDLPEWRGGAFRSWLKKHNS
ncbi:MAG: LutB/LldF family L-lactate oxidation iron-sulfur protein [Verrucomicrobiota bacterium]|jgi:L-lactate dehydrogenase complex protein LldF|nr:MAG: iron-sulfur cluster-binding protein [Verrucomicrobiota bacterium]